jgi:hypothetical protein
MLCAVLASPPCTGGDRTRKALSVAARLLGCEHTIIVNLLGVPTQDVPAMSVLGADAEPWLAARPALTAGLKRGDIVLAGWGVSSLTGAARQHQRDQVHWVAQEARALGHETAWAVGGRPHHPSRWHQYVSDRHGRTPAHLAPEDRLRHVLVRSPLDELSR